jgi:hypothetical protein
MKVLGAAIATLIVLTATAYAADVDGKWTGSITGPAGDFQLAFTFKADGSTLTGSTTGFDGAEIPIQNGKIDGNNISFSVTLDFGGMPLEITYKGVVSAEQIKMTSEFGGMPFEFVLKKAK